MGACTSIDQATIKRRKAPNRPEARRWWNVAQAALTGLQLPTAWANGQDPARLVAAGDQAEMDRPALVDLGGAASPVSLAGPAQPKRRGLAGPGSTAHAVGVSQCRQGPRTSSRGPVRLLARPGPVEALVFRHGNRLVTLQGYNAQPSPGRPGLEVAPGDLRVS